MSREERLNRSYEKPADRYVEWASDDLQFKYYDKEQEKNVLIPLPFKFIVLMDFHTIRGFNEDKNSGFYSNEVEELSKEELNVRLFNGGSVAKGLYSDIKDKIVDMGACYAKSIYILTLDGEIWNVMLKGAAVFAWGEFIKKNRSQLITHSVSVASAEEKKKGNRTYSIPVFEWSAKPITSASIKKADEAFEALTIKLSARAQSLAAEENSENNSKANMVAGLNKAKDQKPGDKPADDFPDPNDMPEEAEVDF